MSTSGQPVLFAISYHGRDVCNIHLVRNVGGRVEGDIRQLPVQLFDQVIFLVLVVALITLGVGAFLLELRAGARLAGSRGSGSQHISFWVQGGGGCEGMSKQLKANRSCQVGATTIGAGVPLS